MATYPRLQLLVTALACAGFLAAPSAQAPDRSRPPMPSAPPEVDLPPIQKRTLSNGIPVHIVELHEVPVAQVTLLVRSGSAAEPQGQFGLASLTAAMLDEGAGSRDALALADAIEFLGASLSTSSSFDASSVALHVPVARLDAALDLMADVAIRPAFPEKELERLRQERLTSLLQVRDNPGAIASVGFPYLVFGADHRYGFPSLGTEATLRSFTVQQLQRFHAEHFVPENASLIVVGDVTPDSVQPKLEAAFGGWKKSPGPVAAAQLGEARSASDRQVFIVDKPGAPQSQVRIGWIGVPRSTPDYFALMVMNTILGGSFTSRLNQNLRETHGYSYGAGSVFDMRAAAGPFYAAAGVQTDKTAEAVTEFFNELHGMLKPVPAEEVEKAKNYLALGFPADFETTSDMASQLAQMIVYDLPDDFFDTYVRRVQAVTPDDVARVAKQHIRPNQFVVVIVGDAKAIEAPVRALKLGPVKVLRVEDVVR